MTRNISINEAVSILESAMEIILDFESSIGIEVDYRCLGPEEVTEAASVALRHFFVFGINEQPLHH